MLKIDRKNFLDDVFLISFSNYRKIRLTMNPSTVVDDIFIYKFIDVTIEQFGIEIDDLERDYIIKNIKSFYSVYQEEGAAILGDYGHDYDWYIKMLEDQDFHQYYWTRYRNYLVEQKKFPSNIVDDKLDKETLFNLMSYVGDPKEESPFSIRGLVVGDVQSGKTSNYIGLITKAADAGYKVIFLLTGTIESLRKQTQIRVEEGFVGYDTVNACDVGVGRGEKTPKAFTSREKDFTGKDDQNTTYRISDYSLEPMIFVIKKNVSVLKKLYASLKNINTNQHVSHISAPMIMIDDEADSASINTNKVDEDPTKINKYIRQILTLFSRNTYVGFTATPFANVFISYNTNDEMLKDDLFPRNFIYSLEAPSNYYGAKKYFFESNNNIRLIEDRNENIFPISHKRYWNGNKLFGSVYEAINSFLIINAIRDIRDIDKNTHRSMLINMSRFTDVQIHIRDIVEEYLSEIIKSIKQNFKLNFDEYITNEQTKSLYDTFEKEFSNIYRNGISGDFINWSEVFENIYESIKNIKVVVVNSSRHSIKLNYEENKTYGLRIIAIGGLALSRGLTLEGLCVSYFYRNTTTFDVLMQMGRWFGYRDYYGDLCKIFLLEDSLKHYREISESIDQLKIDILTMSASNKKPEDYGIRVRNNSDELGITAPNKSRSMKAKQIRFEYAGTLFETPYLHCDLNIIEKNINITKDFVKKTIKHGTRKDIKKIYYTNVDTEHVLELLLNINVHEANINFDNKQIYKFLSKNICRYPKFDVLIMDGSGETVEIINGLNISLVKRNYDIVNNGTLIRMSGQRAHLWGTRDTQIGIDEELLNQFGDLATRKSVTAKDFMDSRLRSNPLFIVYFIDPENKDISNKLIESFSNSKYGFLVGYVIGFPTDNDSNTGNIVSRKDYKIMYYVNTSCNYYEKQHDEDVEMYGDEWI